MTVKPIPDGYTTVAPYLFVDNAKGAIDFYKRAFDATSESMIETPDGRVADAELRIGNAVLRLCDNLPIFDAKAPSELGGTTVEIFLWVEDVDATPGEGGRSDDPAGAHEPVLGRPAGTTQGPVRPPLAGRDADREPVANRD